MDVEAILEQIRARVVSESDTHPANRAPTNGASPNGSAWSSNLDESLVRASAHLAVSGRAWDRLPPVFSNRTGARARIELWIKKTCKLLTRWFTWEQVNFNRAVNDALSDVIEILNIETQQLISLRAELAKQGTELRHLEQMLVEVRGGHAQLVKKIEKLADSFCAGKTQQDQEINRRLSEVAAELKEEQRVCFQQLSLEASESAVLEDRSRRELLARLEKLETEVASLKRR